MTQYPDTYQISHREGDFAVVTFKFGRSSEWSSHSSLEVAVAELRSWAAVYHWPLPDEVDFHDVDTGVWTKVSTLASAPAEAAL